MIYVTVQSNLTNLQSTTDFMWALCDPDQLSGETGYYITMFSSVVEYLKNWEPSEKRLTVNRDFLTLSMSKSKNNDLVLEEDDPEDAKVTLTTTSPMSDDDEKVVLASSPGSDEEKEECLGESV